MGKTFRISPAGTIEYSPGFQPRVYYVSPYEKSPGGTQEKKHRIEMKRYKPTGGLQKPALKGQEGLKAPQEHSPAGRDL